MPQKETVDKLLAESFKELGLTEPIDKITIKEITDKAGVIRPTFYNHFQDKYELLEWIIRTEILEPIMPLFQGGFIKEGFTLIFTNVAKDKEFYSKAVKLEGQNSFESIIKSCVKEILYSYITDRAGEKARIRGWLTPDWLADYYAQSMSFVVITWIKQGMEIPPAEIAGVYNGIMNQSMDDIIKMMEVGK